MSFLLFVIPVEWFFLVYFLKKCQTFRQKVETVTVDLNING